MGVLYNLIIMGLSRLLLDWSLCLEVMGYISIFTTGVIFFSFTANIDDFKMLKSIILNNLSH